MHQEACGATHAPGGVHRKCGCPRSGSGRSLRVIGAGRAARGRGATAETVSGGVGGQAADLEAGRWLVGRKRGAWAGLQGWVELGWLERVRATGQLQGEGSRRGRRRSGGGFLSSRSGAGAGGGAAGGAGGGASEGGRPGRGRRCHLVKRGDQRWRLPWMSSLQASPGPPGPRASPCAFLGTFVACLRCWAPPPSWPASRRLGAAGPMSEGAPGWGR